MLYGEFAPHHTRTEQGWIDFPDDSVFRKSIFPEEVMRHPAKANLYMLEAIIDHTTKWGDKILDPMSGTGSILIALTMGRGVIAIEIEEGYHELQQETLRRLEPGLGDHYCALVHGDSRKILPLPVDHVIFSPPYAAILKTKRALTAESTRELAGTTYEDSLQEYSGTRGNVGNLNRFIYNQEMEKIYAQCFESLSPGGTMTVILKDYIEQGKRVFLSDWLQRVCIRVGFEQLAWYKRLSLGTGFLKLWRSRGHATVSDEDIIIMGRP